MRDLTVTVAKSFVAMALSPLLLHKMELQCFYKTNQFIAKDQIVFENRPVGQRNKTGCCGISHMRHAWPVSRSFMYMDLNTLYYVK